MNTNMWVRVPLHNVISLPCLSPLSVMEVRLKKAEALDTTDAWKSGSRMVYYTSILFTEDIDTDVRD